MKRKIRAKKSFGQHFLNDESITKSIATALSPGNFDTIVEVGPGKGVLTKYLQERKEDLFVVEADRDMVSYLRTYFPTLGDHVISADFLKWNPQEFLGEKSFGLIGNYPYNISSQIVFKMIEYRAQIPQMVGMFQKEVAVRLVSPPGSRDYGILSVLVQAYYDGEYLFTVDKSAFTPPPKVQSGVIRLTRKENNLIPVDEKLFKKVVKMAFSQRRKMLRNTLKGLLMDSPKLEDPFLTQRAEKLSVEDFYIVTKWVGDAMKNQAEIDTEDALE